MFLLKTEHVTILKLIAETFSKTTVKRQADNGNPAK